MCGIVGLYLKNPDLRDRLGAFFSPMLEQMTDRGPDSAGVAIYRDQASDADAKVTLYDPDPDFDWDAVAGAEPSLTWRPPVIVIQQRSVSGVMTRRDIEPWYSKP